MEMTLDERLEAASLGLYVDFSFQHPDLNEVKAAGYIGIIGYLSTDPAKNLTSAEYAQAIALGLDVLLVWETTGTTALGGAAAGVSDASQAEPQAAALGYPTDGDHPLFYAVDFGPTAAQLPAIVAYFAAIGSYAGTHHHFGPYGGLQTINAVAGGRTGATAYWQTVAWSDDAEGNPVVSPLANLYQRLTPTVPNPVPGTDENVLLIPFEPTPPPPTEESNMVTAVFETPGQLNTASIIKGRLIHRWRIAGVWDWEDVGTKSKGGAAAVFTAGQLPGWSLVDGHLFLTAQDSATDWLFDQTIGTGTWGVAELATPTIAT